MKNKKTLKIVLAFVMTLSLLLAGLPVTVLAANDVVCKIGDTEYTSIKEAIQAAQDGDVIDVVNKTTLSSKCTITKKIELTSSNGSRVGVTVNRGFTIGSSTEADSTPGELIVSGNLEIVANKDAVKAIVFINHGTFTIKDEALCKSNTTYVVDSDASGKAPANVNVFGGTLESDSEENEKAAVRVGGTGTVVNMTGGKVVQKQKNSFAFKIAASDLQMNISGGHVLAVNNTLTIYEAAMNKTINITGGIVEATESSTIYTYSNCDYLTVNVSDNALLTAKQNTVRLGSPMSTVNIMGGTVKATEDAPISMGWGTLNISGGKIILEGDKTSAYVVKSALNKHKNFPAFINVSGGLLINDNVNNESVMTDAVEGTTPISFTGGKIIYKENVKFIMEDKIAAPHTTEAIYEGESYYIYNRFAGADERYSGEMDEGATIRFADGGNGLRFMAGFSAEVVSALGEKGDVAYGMLIVPTEYLTNLKEFTAEALGAKYGESGFVNIACTENTGLVRLRDGSVRLQAAIVNIKIENYDQEFSAVAYACVVGEYYYAAFDQSKNAATVKAVAEAALADKAAAYTDSQLAVLNGFAS